jgi:phospholipid transport system substrate-binding protein
MTEREGRHRPTIRPARRLAISAVVALLGLGILSDRIHATASDATEPVQGFYDTLLSTMRSAQSLGPGGRYAKLEPVVLGTFDIPYMTRVAVGPSWAALPAAKQQELIQSFGRYITATWADRFDGYSGEKLEVTGERPYSAAVLVDTRIVKSDGEPVSMNYLMRRDGGAWRIADIYLTGTISELAMRRSEFSAVLRSEGVDGLIALLNRKAGTLGSVAPPS